MRLGRSTIRHGASCSVVALGLLASACGPGTQQASRAAPTAATSAVPVGNARPTAPPTKYPAHFAGLPPVGTEPSKPLDDGRVIVQISPAVGANLMIFADGRVFGPGDLIPTGANPLHMANSQRWLTRQGVQLLRSRILAIAQPTGLFTRNLALGRKAYDKHELVDWYQVRTGGHLIYAQVLGPSNFNNHPRMATAAQMRALDRINTLVTRLPASAWKDGTFRPYIPSHYCVFWDPERVAPDPETLPSPARELLAQDLESSLSTLTTDQARALLVALVQAGFEPVHNSAGEVDWNLPTAVIDPRYTSVSFTPGIPSPGWC